MIMKKIIFIALTVLVMTGCNMAMDSLNIVNGSKFIVKSKTKKGQIYLYCLIKVGDVSWYDYNYRDTTNFEVGDTLTINVTSAKSVGKRK